MPVLLLLLLLSLVEDDLDNVSLHTPFPFLPPVLPPLMPFLFLDPSLGGRGALSSSSLLVLLQPDLSGSGIGVFLPLLLPLFPLDPSFKEDVADGLLLAEGAAELLPLAVVVANIGLLLLLANDIDGDLDTGAALGAWVVEVVFVDIVAVGDNVEVDLLLLLLLLPLVFIIVIIMPPPPPFRCFELVWFPLLRF